MTGDATDERFSQKIKALHEVLGLVRIQTLALGGGGQKI